MNPIDGDARRKVSHRVVHVLATRCSAFLSLLVDIAPTEVDGEDDGAAEDGQGQEQLDA